ncbi:DUF502 domain-containing protein [Aquicoccus porphyridii]|uniref:DUF502 domain-containing protein n=1 Tax=Aquicoccus porphyridii TaxID=1852029 RepID=A0A5A9ZU74_9RHOB|nr:DUF502 domain-containing protein [Aquicoccus porphyridii]KAA0920918.1 DUF502 domain-containing protein [Aquicoccus porphyridii]RAI56542.1 hypothetical protein DOO74_01365 [Rhodobacteraceae bacterium AsT-22]
MTSPFDENDSDKQHRRWRPFAGLRNNFLAGLVVVVPIAITLWLIWTFVGWIDSWVLPFVPQKYHPDVLINRWFGEAQWFRWLFGTSDVSVNIRGVGVILFLVFTVTVGWIAKGLIGRSFLGWGERIVNRMPIVRSVYGGVKQIAETIFAQTESQFDKACLVEYPRKGIWAIAFISTSAKGEIDRRVPVDEEILSVFLPTTPNPTSGFLLFVPRHSVIELEMGVEDAAKLVISAGLVYPNKQDPTQPLAKAEPEPEAAQ